MTAPYLPTGAAEFPNDNPGLHRGARWVCLATRGPARAVVRPDAIEGVPAPHAELAAGEPFLPEARSAVAAPPVASERRFEGPLELDLGRILILHRVEDVPAPPDFIFRPFVPARARALPAPALAVIRIEPRPCRVVDDKEAGRRVERGFRVDIAPCLDVGSMTGDAEPSRRLSRPRGSLMARAVPRDGGELPSAELGAASA